MSKHFKFEKAHLSKEDKKAIGIRLALFLLWVVVSFGGVILSQALMEYYTSVDPDQGARNFWLWTFLFCCFLSAMPVWLTLLAMGGFFDFLNYYDNKDKWDGKIVVTMEKEDGKEYKPE